MCRTDVLESLKAKLKHELCVLGSLKASDYQQQGLSSNGLPLLTLSTQEKGPLHLKQRRTSQKLVRGLYRIRHPCTHPSSLHTQGTGVFGRLLQLDPPSNPQPSGPAPHTSVYGEPVQGSEQVRVGLGRVIFNFF